MISSDWPRWLEWPASRLPPLKHSVSKPLTTYPHFVSHIQLVYLISAKPKLGLEVTLGSSWGNLSFCRHENLPSLWSGRVCLLSVTVLPFSSNCIPYLNPCAFRRHKEVFCIVTSLRYFHNIVLKNVFLSISCCAIFFPLRKGSYLWKMARFPPNHKLRASIMVHKDKLGLTVGLSPHPPFHKTSLCWMTTISQGLWGAQHQNRKVSVLRA